MSNQQELRHRREALAQAVNSHDLEAVLSFVDPSFVAKTKRGVSVGYNEMAAMVRQLFGEEKEYHETVEIENSEVSSEGAELVVRRIERGRFYDPKISSMMVFLGVMFLLMLFLNLPKEIRAGVWDFQAVSGVLAWAVSSTVCLGWGFFMRRSRQRTVRYQETWRTIDGRWLLVEEQEL